MIKEHRRLLWSTVFFLCSCQSSRNLSSGHIYEGNRLAKEGLYQEALISYEKALKTTPKNPVILRNMGMVLVKTGHFEKAAKVLKQVSSVYKKDFEVSFYLGEAQRGQNQYSEAVLSYQKALEIKPAHDKTKKSLLWAYIKSRQYQKALAFGLDFWKKKPKDTERVFILGQTYLKLKQPEKTLNLLSELPQKQELWPNLLLGLKAESLLAQKKTQEALSLFDLALKKEPFSPDLLLGYGKALKILRQEEQATLVLEKAITVAPDLTEAYYLLGQLLESKNRSKAMEYYRVFAKQGAKDPDFVEKIGSLSLR